MQSSSSAHVEMQPQQHACCMYTEDDMVSVMESVPSNKFLIESALSCVYTDDNSRLIDICGNTVPRDGLNAVMI